MPKKGAKLTAEHAAALRGGVGGAAACAGRWAGDKEIQYTCLKRNGY